MHNRFSQALVATCLLTSSVWASARAEELTAQQWLNKMAVSVEQLNYVATFIYTNGQALQSMQVVHRYDETGVRERMFSLSGPPREVVRNGNQVTCILPDDKSVLVEGAHTKLEGRTSLFAPAESINENYRLVTRRGDRVAGRHTQIVEVEPVDVYRYGYRLALDRETALPLQSELIGSKGEALERIVYTNVDLSGDIDDAMLDASTPADGYTWYRRQNGPADGNTQAPQASWRVDWLPKGFEPVNRANRPIRPASSHVTHLSFSDGVASLSVFIEALPKSGDVLEGVSRMGATNAFSRVVEKMLITVVGEVPVRTVKHVGLSIVRTQ